MERGSYSHEQEPDSNFAPLSEVGRILIGSDVTHDYELSLLSDMASRHYDSEYVAALSDLVALRSHVACFDPVLAEELSSYQQDIVDHYDHQLREDISALNEYLGAHPGLVRTTLDGEVVAVRMLDIIPSGHSALAQVSFVTEVSMLLAGELGELTCDIDKLGSEERMAVVAEI